MARLPAGKENCSNVERLSRQSTHIACVRYCYYPKSLFVLLDTKSKRRNQRVTTFAVDTSEVSGEYLRGSPAATLAPRTPAIDESSMAQRLRD